MKQAVITYPDELPQEMHLSEDELVQQVTFLAAAKLFELGRITAGQGARLAGMERRSFLEKLADAGVAAIQLDQTELQAEISAARRLAG